MDKTEAVLNEGLLMEIKEELISLSIRMNTLLLECREKGMIDENEYEGLTRFKKDFIQNQ